MSSTFIKPTDTITGLAILCLLSEKTSEKEMAARVKLTPWVFSRAKNGFYRLKTKEARRIARYFNCSEDFPSMLIHKTCIIEPLRQFIQPKEDI